MPLKRRRLSRPYARRRRMRVRVRSSARARLRLRGRRYRPKTLVVSEQVMRVDGIPGATSGGGEILYQPSEIPQWAAYQALYRECRLVRATVTIMGKFNSFVPGTAAPTDIPDFYWAINNSPEPVGGLTPPTLSAMLQMNGCKHARLSKNIVIRNRPVNGLAGIFPNGPVGGAGVRPRYSTWFSTFGAAADCPRHWGISWFLDQQNYAPTPGVAYDVIIKYTLAFRDPR